MRQTKTIVLCLTSALALAACEKSQNGEVSRTLKGVNVIDESNLNDIMLSAADPDEAVSYFQRTAGENPDRIDVQRGLAQSLIRAKRATEGAVVWKRVVDHEESTNEDKMGYADALIRIGDWKRAETMLDSVPPTIETFQRYKLEAVVADSNKEWKKADSYYETALGLTTTPGGILNNWGYSKLSRGDYREAERLFGESITYDPTLFTAKNNMVLARAAQKNYSLPLIQITQIERAQLLHTMALAAIKQGNTNEGKDLLEQAIEAHPQHFEAAVRSLKKLDG
ncbi:MAG: tetratricopeptide repeat protein [Pseudomonadota bacterium]